VRRFDDCRDDMVRGGCRVKYTIVQRTGTRYRRYTKHVLECPPDDAPLGYRGRIKYSCFLRNQNFYTMRQTKRIHVRPGVHIREERRYTYKRAE
jgi:hypothetical protein